MNPILFEDDVLVIAIKPEGIPVHPTKDPNRLDFTSQVETLLNQNSLRTVNRLDIVTSGITVLSKDPKKNSDVDQWMRSSQKLYLFVCNGNWNPDQISYKNHLKEKKQKMIPVFSGGDVAITHFKKLLYHEKDNISLVRAILDTGRRHQIRTHAQSLGFPILGDQLYGGIPSDRVYLHSTSLRIDRGNGPEIWRNLPSQGIWDRFDLSNLDLYE
jgi:23S rRNA pseudouridine1911/1915/1917 synthase